MSVLKLSIAAYALMWESVICWRKALKKKLCGDNLACFANIGHVVHLEISQFINIAEVKNKFMCMNVLWIRQKWFFVKRSSVYIKMNNPCSYWCMRPSVFEVITKPNTPTWALIFIAYLRFHTAVIYPHVGKLVGQCIMTFMRVCLRSGPLCVLTQLPWGHCGRKTQGSSCKAGQSSGSGPVMACIKWDILASWIWHICCISKVVWIRLCLC